MKLRLETIRKGLIYLYISFGLTSCYVHEKTFSWVGSTYNPTEYTFKVDSVYLRTHGAEKANWLINKGMADEWIEDSITYNTFYLKQKSIKLPIVPFVYGLRFNRKNSLFGITIKLHDVKLQYKILDSISYKFYDTTGTMLSKGSFDYRKGGLYYDTLLETGYHIFMPNVIEIAPLIEQSDMYGDIELYLTDKDNNPVKLKEHKVIFKYQKSNRITAEMNW